MQIPNPWLIWKKHSFEIVIILSIVFLLGYWLFRLGKKGSYDKEYLIYSNNKPSIWKSLTYYFDLGNEFSKPPPKTSNEVLNPFYSERNDSMGERECRRVLEGIFKKPFPKTRPKFLNNDVTGKHLEIDCYNEELGIALEYQGQQHYKYCPRFHANKDQFETQKYRDLMKKQKIQEKGLVYIEVPYTVKPLDIESYIIDKLRQSGVL